MGVEQVFPTLLYRAKLRSPEVNRSRLLHEIKDVAGLDHAGKHWSKENYRNGFTSYASANSLQKNYPAFADLERKINGHVRAFARALDFDLRGGALEMTNCWVNIMPANVHHGLHLHPLSVISGTFYVTVPRGASAIKFEDPRLASFMGAPPRKANARRANQTFIEMKPENGSLVLFESWLRHEVPLNSTRQPRISVSFNYDWK